MGVRWAVPAALLCALALSSCGGDDEQQSADEPAGTYQVDVQGSFPERQQLAQTATLRVKVRNTGTEPIPNVAVSIDGASRLTEQQGAADPRAPVWVVDGSPRAGVTAYVSTWALGRLAPGAQQEYVWKMTPIVAGTHTLRWRVAGNLTGSAKAELAGGAAPEGTFRVRVASAPRSTKVDPDTGNVVSAGQ